MKFPGTLSVLLQALLVSHSAIWIVLCKTWAVMPCTERFATNLVTSERKVYENNNQRILSFFHFQNISIAVISFCMFQERFILKFIQCQENFSDSNFLNSFWKHYENNKKLRPFYKFFCIFTKSTLQEYGCPFNWLPCTNKIPSTERSHFAIA